MHRSLALLSLALCASTCKSYRPVDADSEVKFYGTDSRRAEMTFSTHTLFDLPRGFSGTPEGIMESPLGKDVKQAVNQQLAHMFGAFTQHVKPFNFVESPGIPRDKPEISYGRVTVLPGKKTVKIAYTYKDIVVFKKDLFHGAEQRSLAFHLPEHPASIYAKGLVPIDRALRLYQDDSEGLEELRHQQQMGESKVNLCTDLHYNTEGDYWYFWNPEQLGCPQATKDALLTINAKLRPLNSTANTYPEYQRLLGDNGNGKELRIVYLVGVDETFRQGDLGREGFQKAFRLLSEGKAIVNASDADTLLTAGEREMLAAVADDDDIVFKVSQNEPFHKTLNFKTDKYSAIVDMYLTDPNDDNFIDSAIEGLTKGDVFIYDGHSGLGGYLSVRRIFGNSSQTLPTNKYQIFYFNGCSTFSYYNTDFFNLKKTARDPKGTRNLDIITTGIGAPFTIGPGGDVWLIRHLVGGQRPSWQKIIDTIYRVEPAESALTHVNGDEDNPRSP